MYTSMYTVPLDSSFTPVSKKVLSLGQNCQSRRTVYQSNAEIVRDTRFTRQNKVAWVSVQSSLENEPQARQCKRHTAHASRIHAAHNRNMHAILAGPMLGTVDRTSQQPGLEKCTQTLLHRPATAAKVAVHRTHPLPANRLDPEFCAPAIAQAQTQLKTNRSTYTQVRHGRPEAPDKKSVQRNVHAGQSLRTEDSNRVGPVDGSCHMLAQD